MAGTTHQGCVTATGPTVSAAMVTLPKTHGADTTVAEAVALFDNPHVHMLLVTDGHRLLGTVVRDDLTGPLQPAAPVLSLASTAGRTVSPQEPTGPVLAQMRATGVRRLAVVVEDRLLGLLCAKRDHSGFCSDEGVAARAAEREAGQGTDATGTTR